MGFADTNISSQTKQYIMYVSCQLIGSKSNPTLLQVKYLIEHTVALIQQADNIE